MAWERILQQEQLEMIIDTDKTHLMIEAASGGAVPRFITIHIDTEQEIDELIEALRKAKSMFNTLKA